MDELVSIITVAYNSEATIRDTIESVLNQTYHNIEYILIDGLSKDATVEIAMSYKKEFEQQGILYTVVSEKDTGIYDAMNKGIRMAQGKIIGMINSDDWYELNAVERVVDTYFRSNFDVFYADLRIIKPKGAIIKHSKWSRIVSSRHWNHPTTFITKKVYEKYQYKQETIHDDWDLMLRLRRAGFKTVIINEVLANFRVAGVSNAKSLKKSLSRIKARYRIYRNNGYSLLYIIECIAIEIIKFLIT